MAKYEIKDGVGIIPEGTTKIEKCAFIRCKDLISVNIPDTVTVIGEDAFRGCVNLTSIVIPDSVTSIGSGAFVRCSNLGSIVIPAGVTNPTNSLYEFTAGVFEGCTNLKSIRVAEGNPQYDSREDCNAIIDTARNELLLGCATTVIPKSVTKIRKWTYSDAVTEVFIPEWIEEIHPYAFWECKNLKEIKVAEANPVYDSRNGCNAIIETATNKLICGCTTTVFPDKVSAIGESAFYGRAGLTSIVIPDSVKEIGNSAFRYCFELNSIVFGKGVKTIGEKALYGCDNIETVTFKSKAKGIDNDFFTGYSQLKTIYAPANAVAYYKKCFGWPLEKQVVEIPE